jgi:hypothetical protein
MLTPGMVSMPLRRLVPPEFFDMMLFKDSGNPSACTAPLPARSKSPWNRTSCRNARRPEPSIFRSYTIVIPHRRGDRATADPALSLPTPGQKQKSCAKAWWRAAGVAPRTLLIHQRRAADRVGLHGRRYQWSESGERLRSTPAFSLDSPTAGVELGARYRAHRRPQSESRLDRHHWLTR